MRSPLNSTDTVGSGQEASGESVFSEWNRMRVEPPRTLESTVAVKIDAYLAYLGKTRKENLTEAEFERAFSAIKYAFPRLRSRSNEDLVEATPLGASAVEFLRNYEFDGDEPKTTKLKDKAARRREDLCRFDGRRGRGR
jgi:hypothetical protein